MNGISNFSKKWACKIEKEVGRKEEFWKEEKIRKETKVQRREGKRKKGREDERKDGGRESKAVFLNGGTDLFQLD